MGILEWFHLNDPEKERATGIPSWFDINKKAPSKAKATSYKRPSLVDQVMAMSGLDRGTAQGIVDAWHANFGTPQNVLDATGKKKFTQAQITDWFNQFVGGQLKERAKSSTALGSNGMGTQMFFSKMLQPYLDQSYNDYNSAIAGNDATLDATVNAVNLPAGFGDLFKANRARESASQKTLNSALKQNTVIAPVWDEIFRQLNESRSQMMSNYWNTVGNPNNGGATGTSVRDQIFNAMYPQQTAGGLGTILAGLTPQTGT